MSISLNGTNGLTFNDGTSQATAASGFGFKNRLINGGLTVDQRNAGASQTITAGAALAYTVDRWYAYCTGSNATGQQIAGAYTSSQSRYQFTGGAGVTAIGFGQRIEQNNSFDLANTTATLSCYISNSLLTTVTWTAYYANTANTFGTLASPTRTQIATGTFTVTSTRTQYSTNISIPSAATTGIEIVFSVGAQTSGTWIIDSIQLEKGSVATGFDYRPYGTEFALCQRYYYTEQLVSTVYEAWVSYYGGSFCVRPSTYIPQMRTSPTVTFSGTVQAYYGGAWTNMTISLNQATSNRVVITGSLSASPGTLVYTPSGTSSFYASAEL